MRSHTKFQATRTCVSSRSRVPGGYVELSLGWGFDNKCISNRQNVRSGKILVIMSVEKIVFVNVL